MNPKISWCSGLALPVLLVSAALTACGEKTTTTSREATAVALLRFNATNGAPDTSLGGSGMVTTKVSPSRDDVAFATVLQPTGGKIIVVGTSFTTPASIVVIRYNADGTRDSTFGSNGTTVTSLPSADANAFAATLQADGKLLVAGRSWPVSGFSSFLLLRYHTNANMITGTPGTLDAGFGTGGIVTTGVPSGTSTGANAVAVSGTDILVAGQSKIGGRFMIALARYDSSGALVSTFGSGGIVTTPIFSLDAAAAALAVQTDGKIVAAGLAGSASTDVWDVALLRYNANGSLDTDPITGFGGGTGIVTTDIGSSSNFASAVALQTDGKIVVVGNAFVNSFAATSDIAVLRYNTNGSLDTTAFGSPNGYVTTSIGAFDNGFAVAVEPGGKIVVAGNADAGMGDRLALLRYNANGSPDLGFGTSGIVTRNASGPSIIAGAFAVALQPGGEIVVAGYD